MNCSLIMVGTELLNGATLDTNSIYMAEELNKYGIEINYKLAVGDELDKIIKALEFAKANSDLIILSGGLGPTDDDLTKDALGKFLNKKLIVEDKDLEELKEKFKRVRIEILNKNYKEVQKPEGSMTIKNDVGMAPAIYIDNIVAFPGVPRELKNMFPKFLDFYMKEKGKDIEPIFVKDIIVIGIPESYLEEQIKEYFTEPNIKYEFLVKDYGIVVRLQCKFREKNKVEIIKEKIYNTIRDNIIGEDDDRLEEKLFKEIEKRKLTLSVSESCTGGLLTAKLVSVPGVSQILKEGLVTYSNESKIKRLKVKEDTLINFGAVSEQVAREMLENLESDLGISTTGVAGPSGGTAEKPVGLVYIGIKVGDKIEIFKFELRGNRKQIRERAVQHGLFKLYKLLKEDK